MRFSPAWYVTFGLALVFALYIVFDKDPQPNQEKIKSLEYAIAISDKDKKALEDKHKKETARFVQKLTQARDSLKREQNRGVKLASNLQALKSKPAVVKIIQENPAVDSVFQQYDLLLETKDNQIAIQTNIIKGLEAENTRITDNFMERLQLSQAAFDNQKLIADSYKKDTRKVRRANKLLKVAAVIGTVGGR